MKNLIQKSLSNLTGVLFVGALFAAGPQAATFDENMKLGVVNANSVEKEVVIYNDDYTKCLSDSAQDGKNSKHLSYTACRMDDADTWVLTSAGKIKNKLTGKCLSTPKGENNLVQSYCNYEYIRDYTAHELVVFEN